jgi:starch synthase
VNLAKRIYAGSDMFLMPSLFEPCGLAQMICLRYGTIPIARETGGLKDTVFPYDGETGTGNGFTFKNYNAHDMLFTVQRAVDIYKRHPGIWRKMQKNGMARDFSWTASASRYIGLYNTL